MKRQILSKKVIAVAVIIMSGFLMSGFLPWNTAREAVQDLAAALSETQERIEEDRQRDEARAHSTYLRSVALENLHGSTTRLPVLAYHQVLSPYWYYPVNVLNPWVLSKYTFEAQMRYLYENGYSTISSAQLTGFLHHGEALPPNAVMITFDDGYLDNAVYAYPIMKEFGFTGIIFVITSFLADEPGSLRAYPAQFMYVADMERVSGVFEFGSHTHDMHRSVNGRPMLPNESVENIRADLQQSFAHDFMNINAGFAYPYGRHSANAVLALQQEGVPFAFATHYGYVEQGSDIFRLPRFSITPDISPEQFTQRVSGVWRR